MSGYGMTTGAKQTPGSNRVWKARKVKQKLTWRQRLRMWFNKDLEDIDRADIPVQADAPGELGSEGMRFQLYRASGGYVVEFRSYDSKADRHNYHLYIIHKDKDIGHEPGKIITMESLR